MTARRSPPFFCTPLAGRSRNRVVRVEPELRGQALTGGSVAHGTIVIDGARLYFKVTASERAPEALPYMRTAYERIIRRVARARGRRVLELWPLPGAARALTEEGLAVPLATCLGPGARSVGLAYPRVEGETFRGLLPAGEPRLGDEEARRLFCRIARLVEAVESVGVIHGDLHHGNIMFLGGRLERPVIIDFDGAVPLVNGRLPVLPLYRPLFDDFTVPIEPRLSFETPEEARYLDYTGLLSIGARIVASSRSGAGPVGGRDSTCCLELPGDARRAFERVLGRSFTRHLEHMVREGRPLPGPHAPVARLLEEMRGEGSCA